MARETSGEPKTALREAYEKGKAQQQAVVDEVTMREAKSTPTPTQEENDLAKLGLLEEPLADDGSGPDPSAPEAGPPPTVEPGTDGRSRAARDEKARAEMERKEREASTQGGAGYKNRQT